MFRIPLLVLVSIFTIVLVSTTSFLNAQQAPEKFQVQFVTSNAPNQAITLNVTRSWSPHGVDRFYELVQQGYYNNNGFFRVVPGFVVQFGINGDPSISAKWANENILDDPVVLSNVRGTVAFAMTSEPNSRTTQLYVNYGDNSRLDGMGFAPFAKISESDMKVLDRVYSGYGQSPDQDLIYQQGNKYLQSEFPKLDYIQKATLVH